MPVAATDIKQFKAANHPSTDTDIVGGAISAIEVLGTTVGEIFPAGSIVAQASGGVDEIFFYKSFVKNANATAVFQAVKVWLINGIDQLGAASVLRVASTSASDGATKKVRIYGKNNVNSLIETEDLTLNGTTVVISTKTWIEIYRVVIMLVSDSSVTTAVGDIELRNSALVLLGIIPGSAASGAGTGYSWATAELDIGLAAAQNDVVTSTNRKTAPTGITFTRPNTEGEGLAIPGVDLGAGATIGVWWKMTVKPNMTPPPASGVQSLIKAKGTTV